MAEASNGREARAARARRRSSSRVSKSSRSVIAELRSQTVKEAGEPGTRPRRRASGRLPELRRVEPRDIAQGKQGPVIGVEPCQGVGEIEIGDASCRIHPRSRRTPDRELDDASAPSTADELT